MPPGNNPKTDHDSFEELERERARRRRKSKVKKQDGNRDDFRPRPMADRKRPRRRDWLQYVEDHELVEELDELALEWPRTKRRPLPQNVEED